MTFFNCYRCGKCCNELGLPYDAENLTQIADYLKININEVIFRYYGSLAEDEKSLEFDDDKRTPCPFLKLAGETISCAIYSVRPSGCKEYPLYTDCGRQGVDCPGAKVV